MYEMLALGCYSKVKRLLKIASNPRAEAKSGVTGISTNHPHVILNEVKNLGCLDINQVGRGQPNL
jgi:hypothetical protein